MGDAVFFGDLTGQFDLKWELLPDLGNAFLPIQEKEAGEFEIREEVVGP